MHLGFELMWALHDKILEALGHLPERARQHGQFVYICVLQQQMYDEHALLVAFGPLSHERNLLARISTVQRFRIHGFFLQSSAALLVTLLLFGSFAASSWPTLSFLWRRLLRFSSRSAKKGQIIRYHVFRVH